MADDRVRRDYGATWKDRLAEARDRAGRSGPRLSDTEIADLRTAVTTLDVSSPEHKALLWSGRAILTDIKMDESAAGSGQWWDKLSCREAEVFRKLGIGFSVDDTAGGQFLTNARLHYPEDDPLAAVAQTLWEDLSTRFVAAAAGRVEVIAEGSFDDSVFHKVEFDAILANPKITAVNGLDRRLLVPDPAEAFALLRLWDVERSRRYSEFIAAAADATPEERATALDDFREIQLWYEQDFFDRLGPGRELPALPATVAAAIDQAKDAETWKYSAAWRSFIQNSRS